MKKIKILTTEHEEYDYDTIYHHYNITDWEEVDDETYDTISKWAHKHNSCVRNGSINDRPYYVIIAEFKKSMKWCVQNYLELMEKEKREKEKRKVRIYSVATPDKNNIFSEPIKIGKKGFTSLANWAALHNGTTDRKVGIITDLGDAVSGRVATKEEVDKEVRRLIELDDRYR